jgi:hypothetical protein
MNEAEQIKMSSVFITGNDIFDKRIPQDFKEYTLDKVIRMIQESSEEDEVKAGLLKFAKSYPHQALKSFVLNIDKYIQRVKENASKK